jgi:transcriptional regulator with XRE-family HTH domain
VKTKKTVKTPRRSKGTVEQVETRFGDRLKSLRLKQGLTQKDLADQWGLDRSHYVHLEHGDVNASLQMLEAISIGFGITLSELLKGV